MQLINVNASVSQGVSKSLDFMSFTLLNATVAEFFYTSCTKLPSQNNRILSWLFRVESNSQIW